MANMQSVPSDLHVKVETIQQAVDGSTNAGMQTLVQSPSQLDHDIHNSTLPINRVSNELLIMIFICALDDEPLDESTNLLAISYVCRRWRMLAISTPLLYSRIDMRSWNTQSRKNLLNMFLKRAQSMPVDLGLPAMDVWSASPFTDILSSHAGHIRRLSITLADSGFFHRLNFPLPQLDFLSLIGWPLEDTATFSPSIGQFPVLRTLSLSLVMVPWDSGIFTSLVSLDLSGIRMLQNVSARTLFLDMLERCNDLRHLELDGVLPTQHGGAIQDLTRIVRVPNLQKLLISDEPPYIPWLLKHLSLRSSTLVNIDFRESDDHPFEFPYVSRLFPHQVRDNLAAFSQARFLTILTEREDELLIIADLTRDVGDEFEANLAFSIVVDEYIDVGSYMPALLQDIASLFTSDLLYLKIEGSTDGMLLNHWKSLLNRFPSLETLDIIGYDMSPHLCHALLDCCLHLKRAIMRHAYMPKKDVQALLAYLSSRAASGNKLEHLKIETYFHPLDEDARRLIASYVKFPVEFEVSGGDDTS